MIDILAWTCCIDSLLQQNNFVSKGMLKMKSLKIIALIAFLAIAARAESQLTNISTRGLVQTGDNVQIGGFIIGGDWTEDGSDTCARASPSGFRGTRGAG